jgi:hypothetical protein
MQKVCFFLAMVAMVCLFSGCIAIYSTDFSNIDSSNGSRYSSSAEAQGILLVTVPEMSDLEEKALMGLKQQGALRNIRVRLEMRNFFVVQLYKVIAVGEK